MKLSKRILLGIAALTAMVITVWALPFLFMQAGFTQEVWAPSPEFMGGVAFAPDDDVWVTNCSFFNGTLRRFDAQSTVVVNGTVIHPQILNQASSVGCGITNHPDGFLYSNTSLGVTRQNANTGLPAGGPFGPGGNALGIAPHPLTLELAYVGSGGEIFAVDPAFTTSRTLSTAVQGSFVDGIFFDPSGAFLFTATRTGGFRVSIIDASNGNLVQHVPLASEPDGIAFHATAPKFVVTNNTDGTMSRLDFPGDDFTQPPVVTLFANGGFRGDLSQVGSDGCLYLTQNGTRYDNGTVTFENSVVRVCGGFDPPPGVSECFELDFETDDAGVALVHGQHLGNGDTEFDGGAIFPVVITSSVDISGGDTAAILNSNTGPASQDPDLLVGTGNILILQTDANTNECPPGSGVYCSHNDDEDGGRVSFEFPRTAELKSIVLVDIDATDPLTTLVLTDINGAQRTYSVPANWTGDLITNGSSGTGTLDLTTLAPQPGFASVATASEDASFDRLGVVRMDVNLGGSGALDDLSWCTGTGRPRADVIAHNGTGVNPTLLSNASMPVIGSTWQVQLDCSSYGSGVARLSLCSDAVNRPSPFGEELIAGTPIYSTARSFSAAPSQLSWPIPSNVGLVGLSVHAQGLCIGNRSLSAAKLGRARCAFSNALELRLGY
jgi:hypothetical protein